MDELVARAESRLERMRDLADRMTGVRVRESSDDGAVTVEVDGNGALVDLAFSAVVNRMSPAEFERVVVSTAHSAAARAFAERGDLITAFNEENSTPPTSA
ncbi:MAG: YbaB/EbfC family nucleoid-associated protein [Nocardia sp.]|nr:YbaB/EbfC family nucleoid-associated protein [Nocardia sp.]